MGKRESLLIISVGAIGNLVKFFLDVKLQKGSVTGATTNISDDEEAENAASENDVIASTALEFDALNELLSFTCDVYSKIIYHRHLLHSF